MSYYSSFKPAWHLNKIRALREGKLPMPLACQIDVTNLCNHFCEYCFYRGPSTKIELDNFKVTDTIPIERLKNIVDEAEELGVRTWEITGGGEPLIHPDIGEFLDYLNQKNHEISLVTNGGLLTPEIIKKLTNTAWVRVSLDAATEKTWKVEHCPKSGKSFDEILDMIKLLKKEVNKKCKIGISYVINPLNTHEIVKVAKLAKELKIDNIRFSVSYTKEKERLFKNIEGKILREIGKAKLLEDENFKVFSFGERIFDLALKKKDYNFCGYQHFWLIIGADQKVYPCCTLKLQSWAELGDLKENTVKDVWFSKKRIEWISKFRCHNVSCWHDSKNRFIDYLIKPQEHVNFI